MAKTPQKMDALLFIDTNIYLDFYRIRNSDVSMKYLEEILNHKSIIITSSQVEMEFKKNRQIVILEGISEFKKTKNINLNIPQIVSDTKSVGMLKATKEKIIEQTKKVEEKLDDIFKDPLKHDSVFKSLDKVFQNNSPYNLGRKKEARVQIRELAQKRFNLGYPPRKEKDTSMGDAINWEWIVQCAIESKKDIIIVTRDSDYGASYNNQMHLNDWLRQEFKQRVSSRKSIVLTDKLSVAFKLVHIPVTKEMIEEESNIIEFWKPNDASMNYTWLEGFGTIREYVEKIRAQQKITPPDE
jgi:hypothetical protein